MTRKALIPWMVAFVVGLLLFGCGSTHTSSTKTATTASAVDDTVGAEVKTHIEELNHGNAGIKSVSCTERGPVPSMGTDAVAFLCSVQADNGEAAKPELWASLPMDEETKVELLDDTAERELAARGEVAGLNDGHSESANKSAEEDIRHAEETVSQQTSTQAAPPATTSESTQVTGCGVLKYSNAHWLLGERWRITDSATPCSEAMQVIRGDFSGKGIKHVGSDNAEPIR